LDWCLLLLLHTGWLLHSGWLLQTWSLLGLWRCISQVLGLLEVGSLAANHGATAAHLGSLLALVAVEARIDVK
jgi:hypothetical protein